MSQGALFDLPARARPPHWSDGSVAPVTDCRTCHRRHPVTRRHCPTCGGAHLFPHATLTPKDTP